MKQIGLISAIVSTKRSGKLQKADYTALQMERLVKLVAYAKEHSPYYSKLYSDFVGSYPPADLPPTNKIRLMAHFDEWLTDRSITLNTVQDFMADKYNIGRRLLGKYLVNTTSGSTGNPSVVLMDKTAFNVAAAISALRAFARKSDLREFMRRGKKTAGLYAVDGFYLASGTMRYNQRRMPWRKNQLTIDILTPIPEIVQALNEFQPAMLGSYPSMLELLLPEQAAGRLHISPVLIMPGGEYLREDLRKDLVQVFGCHVQTNYSCTEAGVIACECEHGRLHINEDWCVVEAVDESNQPVPNGTRSEKTLVTNLANYTQPFIRYELNDRIIIHDETCECGNPFRWLEIEGRTDEMLDFGDGVRVAPMSLFALLKPIHEIKRYQIIRHDGNRLEIRLAADNKQAAFEIAKTALSGYLASVHTEAKIYLSKEEPQVHPKSGKFRAVYSAE
jgi:phenylacetate-coenzyme A ligase PaaK-like adenylate-forming protein